MLYNNQLSLWQSAKQAYAEFPNGGPRLTVHDGMVGNGHEVLARFESQPCARKTLKDAGFREISRNVFKA